MIDGGLCFAYRKTTGIAGYTLLGDGAGLRLVTHGEFPGRDAVEASAADAEHTVEMLEHFE